MLKMKLRCEKLVPVVMYVVSVLEPCQWEILRKCGKYKAGTRKCDICLTEKLMILKEKGLTSLNKRSELMYKCPHMRKYRLINQKKK